MGKKQREIKREREREQEIERQRWKETKRETKKDRTHQSHPISSCEDTESSFRATLQLQVTKHPPRQA